MEGRAGRHAARDDDRRRPAGGRGVDHGRGGLLGEPAALDVRVLARRRGVRSLRVAADIYGPHRRVAHDCGARDRPGGKHRPDAGEPCLDRARRRHRSRDRAPFRSGRAVRHCCGELRVRRDRSGPAQSVPVFECSLDGASFAACASPQEYVGLGEGAHAFQVRAVDAAGNVDASPASFAWRVDTIAPETSITSGPDAVTSSTSAAFGFGADEPASFECSLDGGAYAPCASPAEYTGLAIGWHTFSVRATDPDGHVDPTPAGHRAGTSTGPRETTPPVTTIDSGPANPTADRTARSSAFSAERAGRDVRVLARRRRLRVLRLGGSPYTDLGARDAHVPRPGDGRRRERRGHAGELRVDDHRGRRDAARDADHRGPAGDVHRASPRPSPSGQTSPGRSSARSTASRSRRAPRRVTFTNLPAGENTLSVRARLPAAGNADPVPASTTWTVEDDTPPDTQIVSRPTTRAPRTTTSSCSPGPTTTRSSTARPRSLSSSAVSTAPATPRGPRARARRSTTH